MGKKILLADDSITIQKVIELTFSDEDFDVVTVGNGRLAIEKTQEVVPDVVLCDIIMPEKDGYEVCAFIKKTPGLAHIPVLLLTGAFEPFDQDRAARVGCDGFLAKPFEPQTLIAKVKDLLAQTRSAPAPASTAPSAPAAPTGTAQAPPAPAAEFEPLYALPDEPVAVDGGFQPLEPVAEFEPLETVAFEPVVPNPPPPAFEGRPAATSAVPAAPQAFDDVAFIPEEPLEELSTPAPAPAVAAASHAEPAFIPEDDAFPAAAPSFEAEPLTTSEEEEPTAATLPPGWARTTLELPLEERARASVASAYGTQLEDAHEEPALTLEEDAVVSGSEASATEDAGGSTEFEAAPLSELAPDAPPAGDALVDQPAVAPPESIFEAMGLESDAQTVSEPAPEEPEALGEPEALDEMEELAGEPQLVAEPVLRGEEQAAEPFAAAGAEALLDEDLSAAVEFDEPAAVPEPEPRPEPSARALAPESVAPFAPVPEAEPEEELQPLATAELEMDEVPAPVAAAPVSEVSEEVTFDDLAPAPAPEAAPVRRASSAAEVAVPMDMVAQIAQRVVGQISEKVIREIAWEVIPELAEALIKKEIERLKAELQQLPQ